MHRCCAKIVDQARVNSIQKHLRNTGFLGCILLGIFLLLALLGQSYQWIEVIPAVVALLILATIVAMLGLSQSLLVRSADEKKLLFIIVSIALGLRGVAIFTPPILEVDYYRYLWDGKVLASGVSPYDYSPAQVIVAEPTITDSDYQHAVSLSMQSESNHTILQRVHFAQYTTIYPPVSQLVFAGAMKWFSHKASVSAHIIFLKLVLSVFDLLTMLLLLRSMVRRGVSVAWLIVYAWNPLVIKEVANSGHLDSIAVFLVVAAVYFAVAWQANAVSMQTHWPLWSCGLSLALGFGAKLFPIILVPLFFVGFAKVRWTSAGIFLVAFAIPALAISWVTSQSLANRKHAQAQFTAQQSDQQSEEGLSSFLTTWRMNDVIFSGIYRNMKPDSGTVGSSPWYVLSSNDHRVRIDKWFRDRLIGGSNPAFFVTRLITLLAFAVAYAWILFTAYRSPHNFDVGKFVWLLVVFLLLQPTVNPWYWLWVAPLTCFTQNKGWLLVSGVLMVYYLRFWFEALPASYSLGGTHYSGVGLFDHGVAWLEFAAILAVIAWFNLRRSKRFPE